MSLPAPPAPAVGGRIVRPYTLTGGRTGGEGPVIALEALVAATIEGLRAKWRYRWESVEIIELSRRETAIIELAALLRSAVGLPRPGQGGIHRTTEQGPRWNQVALGVAG